VSWRNAKLLETVREFPCTRCGTSDGTVVAAHSNQIRDGKGKGIKSADYRIAALCYNCHMALDQGAELSKEERLEEWEAAHRVTIGLLFLTKKVKVV
jgi:Fe-S oxidoreductase